MVQKKNTTPYVKIAAVLTISNADFKKRISDRIESGEEMLNRTISTHQEFDTIQSEYNIWNDYNLELLKQVFNVFDNDHMQSYRDVGYNIMVGHLGYVEGNPAQSLKNRLQYKLNDLKSLLAKSELIKSEHGPNHAKAVEKRIALSKNEVFIVHGHDNLAETKTARFIEKLGLKPIILHEQSISGNTIIEKIEEHSNVGFGIVLYTPCDRGCKQGEENNLKNRARQNVLFEHGYLIGKIGRKNVCALVKDQIELPNDISGVVYVKMDDEDSWHLKIAKELRNSGYEIDLNKL